MYACIIFYLNKLLKLFILLKNITVIIKTHIKLILNMYNLFSKFYCRERLFVMWNYKIQHQNV